MCASPAGAAAAAAFAAEVMGLGLAAADAGAGAVWAAGAGAEGADGFGRAEVLGVGSVLTSPAGEGADCCLADSGLGVAVTAEVD